MIRQWAVTHALLTDHLFNKSNINPGCGCCDALIYIWNLISYIGGYLGTVLGRMVRERKGPL